MENRGLATTSQRWISYNGFHGELSTEAELDTITAILVISLVKLLLDSGAPVEVIEMSRQETRGKFQGVLPHSLTLFFIRNNSVGNAFRLSLA